LQIGRIGDYIRLLESKLTLPSGLGWETHFYSLGPSARLDIAVGALWGVIIIANLSLALYRNKKLYKNKIILTLSFILLLLAIISFFNWNNSIIRISILLLGLSTTIFIIHTINKSIIK
jgi:hypothetical protein